MINEVKLVDWKKGIHVSESFYDENVQRWVSLACGIFEPPINKFGDQFKFERPLILNGITYNTSAISCMVIDQSKYLDYKKAANTTKSTTNQTRLLSIVNSYMFVADNKNMSLVFVPDSLVQNYNYTSIYSPELVRYTAFTNGSMKSDIEALANKPLGEDSFLNYSVKLSQDPSAPTFITESQIHIRSMGVTYKPARNFTYFQNYLFYFGADDLTVSKTIINDNVKAAQSQINYLALIVITIICAVVMCISFR